VPAARAFPLACLDPRPQARRRGQQQQVLFENTARSMDDALKAIKVRHIANCLKADPAYGQGVAQALGIPLADANK
jgi:catalase